MFIIYNKDGSIYARTQSDFVMQGSNRVNKVFISFVDNDYSGWSCNAVFNLPNNTRWTIPAVAATNGFEYLGIQYQGWVIELTSDVTMYSGNVSMTVQVVNESTHIAYTYLANITINQTGLPLDGYWDDSITVAQFNDYMAQLAVKLQANTVSVVVAEENLPLVGEKNILYFILGASSNEPYQVKMWNGSEYTLLGTINLSSFASKEEQLHFEDEINAQIEQIRNEVINPFVVVDAISQLPSSNQNKLYIVAENNSWYYWNGSEYIIGGNFVEAGLTNEEITDYTSLNQTFYQYILTRYTNGDHRPFFMNIESVANWVGSQEQVLPEGKAFGWYDAISGDIIVITNCGVSAIDNTYETRPIVNYNSLAERVAYDNSNSGLEAANVQDAIDELAEEKLDNSDIEPLLQTQNVINTIDINAKNIFLNKVILPEGVESVLFTSCGKNLLDKSKFVYQKIKNDSGVEVDDGGSSYFNKMIAVVPGETLFINFGAQRIYQYDINGNWLRRTSTNAVSLPYGELVVPNDCHFIQIQYSSANTANTINWDIAQVEVGTTDTTYEEYRGNETTITNNTTYPLSIKGYGRTRLYTFVGSTFEIGVLSKDNTIYIPACGEYELWEPETTTNDYTSPIGRNNVVNPITGQEFLDLYYNIYLGTNADGYKVVKRSLGDDSSHRYELLEYDFIPKHYNKTILLSAGMNPCELPAEWGLAYLIKSIMENHDEDDGLKYLYENVRIKVIPFINPWGFDQTPKKYVNYNGVRINKNFNYKDSWDLMNENQLKGSQPDSENETKILKKWLNDNAYSADLYIDCHTDPDANTPYNIWFQFSTGLFGTLYIYNRDVLIPYWKNKGLDPDNQLNNYAGTADYHIYPKTQYAKEICGIPAIMIEMWSNTTAFGSNPDTMNESVEIKYYVWLLRALVLKVLKSPYQTFGSEDNTWVAFQYKKGNN